MSLKLIILGKAGLQVLTEVFKVNEYFKKKKKNHGIWSHHFMANRWGKSRNSERCYFRDLQNHGDCRHAEIKKCLLLGRKATTSLDSALKSRDIILPTKVHLVKAVAFPVVK